ASAATSRGRVFGSSFTQARAEVSRYSAIPPSVERPGNVEFSQCMSSPAQQARHRAQVGVGCRITVSPTATLVTAEPTSCTQPAFSWPRMEGSGVPIAASHWPSMMCRSVRHTPAPPIFTITSSGPVTFGSGTSSMTGVEWNLRSLTAFMSYSPSWTLSGFCPAPGCRMPDSWLGRPAVRVADPEHPGADGRVGLDARAGDAGLAEVERHRGLFDPCPGRGIDEQRRFVACREAKLGAALAQPGQLR